LDPDDSVGMNSRSKLRTWGPPALLVLASGLALTCYFAPGDILGGDAHSHMARTWLWQDIIAREASFPIWTNRWYFGFPLDLYYGFLYYLLSGLLAMLLAGDAILATKITLWLLHSASGLAMFACVRLLTGSGAAALFAGLFYLMSMQHTGIIILAGALPLSLIFVVLPLCFCAFESFVRSRISLAAGALVTGLLLAALVCTHIQYGMLALFAFYLVALVRIGLSLAVGTEARRARQQALFIACATLTFFVSSAWYLLPLVVEKHDLVLHSSSAAREIMGQFSATTGKRALGIFSWSREMGDWVFFYVGLVPLLVTVCGALLRLQRRDTAFWSYGAAWLLGGLWLLRNDRFVNIWLPLTCILAGYAVAEIAARLAARKPLIAAGLLLALIFDLGPTVRQSPYRPLDNHLVASIQRQLASRGMTGRIMVVSGTRGALWRSLDVVNTNASSPFGGVPQSSTRTHPYMAALASQLAAEVLDKRGSPSQVTRDALRLLNIRVLCSPGLGTAYELPHAYPAWFSQLLDKSRRDSRVIEQETWASIRPKFEERTLDTTCLAHILRTMDLSPAEPLASCLLLHDSSDDAELARLQSSAPLQGRPEFVILHARETHASFGLRYRSSASGYVLLAYSYFPFNRVRIDGAAARAHRSAMNLTVVPIPAGEHVLEIQAGISPLRQALLWLAAIGLVLLLAVGMRRAYKKKNKLFF